MQVAILTKVNSILPPGGTGVPPSVKASKSLGVEGTMPKVLALSIPLIAVSSPSGHSTTSQK